MKKTFFLIALLLFSVLADAQKNKVVCDTLRVDLDSGMVNKIRPDAPMDTLLKYFPCYTERIEEGEESPCGGGLIYDYLNFAIYSYRDYFEIRTGFIGKINYQLWGHNEEYLQTVLGEPVRVTDVQEYDGAPVKTVFFYKKNYGSLLVWLNEEHKIFKIQVSAKEVEKMDLCF